MSIIPPSRRILALVGMFAAAIVLRAQDVPVAAPASAQQPYVQKPELYPMTTCVVSGEDLGADAQTFTIEGRTFKTCCKKCKTKVEQDPKAYAKKLDEVAIRNQAAHYPLDTCVITGKKLGSMGDPVQLLFDGTLVQLCCSGCTKRATANAAAMVQKVREAAFLAQSKTYPLQTCIVSDEKLDDEAVQVMFGTTLVRFCCKKCAAAFEKDPAKYIGKFHPAPKPAGGKQGG